MNARAWDHAWDTWLVGAAERARTLKPNNPAARRLAAPRHLLRETALSPRTVRHDRKHHTHRPSQTADVHMTPVRGRYTCARAEAALAQAKDHLDTFD